MHNGPWAKIIIIGTVFSSIIIFFPLLSFNLPTRTFYIKPTLAIGNQPSGRPIRLKIPKINIDAAFEYVSLTPLGAMDTPKAASNVAWFEPGPRPGDNGSAVITGHYGRWKNGEGSVFDDLNKLKPDDMLYVEDEKGAITAFAVRESRRYDPKADAKDVFNSNDGGSHLNLITCNGVWNKTAKSYSERLVIFTDKK